jgi:hypothetical protein
MRCASAVGMFFAALASAMSRCPDVTRQNVCLAFAAPDINDTARRASLRGEICLTPMAGSIIRGFRRAHPFTPAQAIGVANHQASLSQRPPYLVNASTRLRVQSRGSIAGGISASAYASSHRLLNMWEVEGRSQSLALSMMVGDRAVVTFSTGRITEARS